jgi:hypothetical protein
MRQHYIPLKYRHRRSAPLTSVFNEGMKKNMLCHHADGLVRWVQGIHIFFPLILFKRSILVGSPQKSQVPDSIILALGGISGEISSILNIDSGSASRIFCTRACWSFLNCANSLGDASSF